MWAPYATFMVIFGSTVKSLGTLFFIKWINISDTHEWMWGNLLRCGIQLFNIYDRVRSSKQNTLCIIVKINISACILVKKNTYSSRHILPIKLHKIYYWIESWYFIDHSCKSLRILFHITEYIYVKLKLFHITNIKH